MKKVAVIGAGRWGKNLVRTFHQLGRLDAVVDSSLEVRKQLANAYPDIQLHSSEQEILESPVSAVVIASPSPTHYAFAKAALEAGKDVFIEKPMTLSVKDAEDLIQTAEDKGLILMVGHLLLYQPAMRWIKNFVDRGHLGKLYSIHQKRLKLGRVRRTENVLWSLGVHDLAVMLFLIGTTPTKMWVHGQTVLQPETEDDVYLHIHFADSVHAHLHISWLWPYQERSLILIGSKGMLEYDEITQSVTFHRKRIDSDLNEHDQGSELVFRCSEQPLLQECRHFLHCLDERTAPLTDGRNSLEVIRLLEQANRLFCREGVMMGEGNRRI